MLRGILPLRWEFQIRKLSLANNINSKEWRSIRRRTRTEGRGRDSGEFYMESKMPHLKFLSPLKEKHPEKEQEKRRTAAAAAI